MGAMTALNKALMPPSPHAVVVEEDPKKMKQVQTSVADLTKIALELHLKQLEAKAPPAQQQQQGVQQQQQQHFSIGAPGEHLPRAVAAIAKGTVCMCMRACACMQPPTRSAFVPTPDV